MGAARASGWMGGDGDLPYFVMRENFLIIFIQIFLINSLIFFGRSESSREIRRDGEKCNQIILLNGKISSSKADYLSKFLVFLH